MVSVMPKLMVHSNCSLLFQFVCPYPQKELKMQVCRCRWKKKKKILWSQFSGYSLSQTIFNYIDQHYWFLDLLISDLCLYIIELNQKYILNNVLRDRSLYYCGSSRTQTFFFLLHKSNISQSFLENMIKKIEDQKEL